MSDHPVHVTRWSEIMWTGAKEAEVRKRFPDCPELNGLTVWPADRRSRGVGTRMIEHATRLVQQRGFAQVGLGVDDDNPRAAALYLKLGFAETGVRYLDHWASSDRAGRRRDFADPCRFLVKHLQKALMSDPRVSPDNRETRGPFQAEM